MFFHSIFFRPQDSIQTVYASVTPMRRKPQAHIIYCTDKNKTNPSVKNNTKKTQEKKIVRRKETTWEKKPETLFKKRLVPYTHTGDFCTQLIKRNLRKRWRDTM